MFNNATNESHQKWRLLFWLGQIAYHFQSSLQDRLFLLMCCTLFSAYTVHIQGWLHLNKTVAALNGDSKQSYKISMHKPYTKAASVCMYIIYEHRIGYLSAVVYSGTVSWSVSLLSCCPCTMSVSCKLCRILTHPNKCQCHPNTCL